MRPKLLNEPEAQAAYEAAELAPALERARGMWPIDDYRRQALEEEYARLWGKVAMPTT